jgi:hypothetical protein
MKLVKMSLAAAVLLGASAFAIDNVKVSGDAKLFYITQEYYGDGDLFDKDTSAADTALRLSVTGDLTKGVSFGATGYAISTLGLENNLVSNTITHAHDTGNGVDDQAWMGELWVAATLGKTTAKLGRMELDTPLAFSEKWSIVPNTFDAAVLINTDLPDTTLVGAWVGKGNGINAGGGYTFGYYNFSAVGLDGMGAGAKFGTFADKGAYVAGIVNNSFKPLVAQAWYYNVMNVADAYWLQADWNCQLVKGVKVGVQYADISPKGGKSGILESFHDSSAYAVQLAYSGVEKLDLAVAYSSVDKKSILSIANIATNNFNTAQSKLYTEAWWTYGVVGRGGSDTWNFAAKYDAGFAKLGAQYTYVDNSNWDQKMKEAALSASKSFGPLDVTLAYVNTDWKYDGGNDDNNMIHAYLTLNF